MEPLPGKLLDELSILDAVGEEVKARRNLVPPEPWLPAVATERENVADWVMSRLQAGSRSAPTVTINAWKGNHGTRPVAVMGLGERIAYRALACIVTNDVGRPDRSASAYRDFILGPIQYWLENFEGFRTFGSAPFRYVVETDLVAFYDYIDHQVLRHELEVQTGRVDATAALAELLNETAQRAFGLPQLYDPSDWLSDVYASILEHDVVRQGFHVWRYNDDFRIGVRNYPEAFDAIERLESSARLLGLTLSTHKTFTPTFLTYFMRNTGLEVSDEAQAIDPHDVEAIVTAGDEYTAADIDATVAEAHECLARLRAPPQDPERIDLKNVSTADLRMLRRTFAILTSASDPIGVEWVERLFEFVPALTPRLIDYAVAMADVVADGVARVLSRLRTSSTLREWQAIWLLHAYREVGQMTEPAVEWAQTQLRGFGRPLAAEAALSLATVGRISFSDLDEALRVEPQVLAPWYVLGMRYLHARALATDKQIGAVRRTSPLYRWVLDG